MDITSYVETLRSDLTAVAEAGGPDARETAQRLLLALEPAVRLAFVEALSHAAAEITTQLPGTSVDVRMHGREPRFVVESHAAPPTAAPGTESESPEPDDEEDVTVARVTVRIPEPLKARAEELASRTGISLNSWIVNAVRAATRRGAIQVDVDLPSFGNPGGPRGRGVGRRMTGWV